MPIEADTETTLAEPSVPMTDRERRMVTNRIMLEAAREDIERIYESTGGSMRASDYAFDPNQSSEDNAIRRSIHRYLSKKEQARSNRRLYDLEEEKEYLGFGQESSKFDLEEEEKYLGSSQESSKSDPNDELVLDAIIPEPDMCL